MVFVLYFALALIAIYRSRWQKNKKQKNYCFHICTKECITDICMNHYVSGRDRTQSGRDRIEFMTFYIKYIFKNISLLAVILLDLCFVRQRSDIAGACATWGKTTKNSGKKNNSNIGFLFTNFLTGRNSTGAYIAYRTLISGLLMDVDA